MPKVNKISVPEYELKQPKSDVMSQVPLRGLLVAPTGGFKTTLLANLLTHPEMYRGVFDRVYIFSPTIHLDDTWFPVKKYIYEKLGHDEEKEGPACFENFDVPAIKKIIQTQKNIRQHLAAKYAKPHWRGPKTMPQVILIIDDFSDRPDVLHKTGGDDVLATLYVKCRHYFISVLSSVQKFKSIANVVRSNATCYFIGRLKSSIELNHGILEEMSAIVDRATLLEMYQRATRQPHSFFFIDLSRATGPRFFINFETELRKSEEEETG